MSAAPTRSNVVLAGNQTAWILVEKSGTNCPGNAPLTGNALGWTGDLASGPTNGSAAVVVPTTLKVTDPVTGATGYVWNPRALFVAQPPGSAGDQLIPIVGQGTESDMSGNPISINLYGAPSSRIPQPVMFSSVSCLWDHSQCFIKTLFSGPNGGDWVHLGTTGGGVVSVTGTTQMDTHFELIEVDLYTSCASTPGASRRSCPGAGRGSLVSSSLFCCNGSCIMYAPLGQAFCVCSGQGAGGTTLGGSPDPSSNCTQCPGGGSGAPGNCVYCPNNTTGGTGICGCANGSSPVNGQCQPCDPLRTCNGRGTCSAVDGSCNCQSGFYGLRCEFQYNPAPPDPKAPSGSMSASTKVVIFFVVMALLLLFMAYRAKPIPSSISIAAPPTILGNPLYNGGIPG